MARVLVTYHSRSGNTQAMAHAVADGAREADGAEVDLLPANKVDPNALLDYDAVIVGSPTYYGQMAAEVKALFDRSVVLHGQLEGKVGGAFTSSGNLGGGNETCLLSILQALLVHGMVVEGSARHAHYGAVAIGEPDDRALADCRALGRRVADLAARLGA